MMLNAAVVVTGVGLVYSVHNHKQSLKRADTAPAMSQSPLVFCPGNGEPCQARVMNCETVAGVTNCKATVTVGQRGT